MGQTEKQRCVVILRRLALAGCVYVNYYCYDIKKYI